MITTSPVTMRVDTKVLKAVKAEAKATGVGYQTIINMKLSDYTGIALAAAPKKAERPKLKASPLVVSKKAKAKKPAKKTKRGPYKKAKK